MNTKQKLRLYLYMKKTKNFWFRVSLVCSFVSVLCLLPLATRAAILYLTPSEDSYSRGETFVEEVRLDTEGEDINTVKVDLNYPKDTLEIVDFSDGGSVLTLWVKTPLINTNTNTEDHEGLISLIGGIPNGFKGKGLIGKIIFRVHETGTKQERETDTKLEFLEGTQVLLNDGKGTIAKLTTTGAIFEILAQEPESLKDNWQEILKKDNIPPESFEIIISNDPSIFEGKYFISFWTQDKESGVDYYEVKEGAGNWEKNISPYILQDQSLKSIIKVKAVDKAGNERIEIFKPKRNIFLEWLVYVGIGLVVIWIMYRGIKNKIFKKPR